MNTSVGERTTGHPFLSVIIPVFNTDKYIRRCVESIITQPFNHLEILLINDGSTDQSAEICDQLARENPLISVIHQKNEGPGIARNRGLDSAKGKYLHFVDSDDYVIENSYQEIWSVATESEPDLIAFGYEKMIRRGSKKYRKTSDLPDNDLKSGTEVLDALPDLMDRGLRFSLWNKWFRRDRAVQHGIRFPGYRRSQDMAFTIDFLSIANSLRTTHTNTYLHDNQYLPEKYDREMIPHYVQLFKKMDQLFAGQPDNKRSSQYLAKLFVFWFFYKIPSILTNGVHAKASIRLIREMHNLPEIQQYLVDYSGKKHRRLSVKAAIFLMRHKQTKLTFLTVKMISLAEPLVKGMLRRLPD